MRIEFKTCNKCGLTKKVTEFYKDRSRKDGLTYSCKVCKNKTNREWAEKNPNRVKRIKRKHYEANKAEFIEKGKRWIKENPEKYREIQYKWRRENKERYLENRRLWRLENKEKENRRSSEWRKNNRDKVNKTKRAWELKQKHKNAKYNLNHRISNAILKALKRNKNGYHWEDLAGYSLEDLKRHLESQFKDNMTWNKFLDGEIHIDHIIPKSLFEYNSPEDREFKQCWALCNLQPLWAEDNIRKSNKCQIKTK